MFFSRFFKGELLREKKLFVQIPKVFDPRVDKERSNYCSVDVVCSQSIFEINKNVSNHKDGNHDSLLMENESNNDV